MDEEGNPIGFASNSKDISIELKNKRTLKKLLQKSSF